MKGLSQGEVEKFLTEGCRNGPCAYWILGVAYLVLAVAALVQFVRIQLRLSESGWTLQKAFHLFNVVLCVARGITLFFWHDAEVSGYATAGLLLLDVPTLMFFTTYTLLALFWAEIVYAGDKFVAVLPPRYSFLAVNFVVYLVVAISWILVALSGKGGKTATTEDSKDNNKADELDEFARLLSTWFQIGLNFAVATVFVVFGAKLFTLLKKSEVQADFKKKKMVEVFSVGLACVICFLSKVVLEIVMRWKKTGGDFHRDNVLLNSLLLGVTEVLVIATVLGLMSDLPPAQKAEQAGSYQRVADEA